MKQNQFEFKPFDKVLVRDSNSDKWNATLFSRTIMRDGKERFVNIASSSYEQCIPYNESTAHLLGTSEPYQESEPKIYHVKNALTDEEFDFTQSQFDAFIKDIRKMSETSYYCITHK